jgi:hypothetical protein
MRSAAASFEAPRKLGVIQTQHRDLRGMSETT